MFRVNDKPWMSLKTPLIHRFVSRRFPTQILPYWMVACLDGLMKDTRLRPAHQTQLKTNQVLRKGLLILCRQ